MTSSFVLDCSVTMTWLFLPEATKNTLLIRDKLSSTSCFVPSIWPLEVNNVLWVATKNKKITEVQASRFRYILKNLPIKIDLKASDLGNDVVPELSKEFNISSYDAAYLELALREHLPLATLDKNLIKASKSVGVDIL